MYEIVRYDPSRSAEWDRFVLQSKNGTFLFLRNYMDYHADRFTDCSLLVYKNSRLTAIFPANIDGEIVYSHQGLTYGGLMMDLKATVVPVREIFIEINRYFTRIGVTKIVYKAIPWIYHRYPAEEDIYIIHHLFGARLIARHISSSIELAHKPRLAESRKSGIRKALSHGLSIREGYDEDIDIFWKILSANLHQKYGASPVHTAAEMALLMQRFPQNIRLYCVYDHQEMLAGTILYQMEKVVHVQYISASPEGKKDGALDLLFDHLLAKEWGDCVYFDFGKSSDGNGEELNDALIFQKEGFGGRGICYDWYEWDCK